MIRQAVIEDASAIADTYDRLLAYEQARGGSSNWISGVYPTIKVPQARIPSGSMYVLEENGEICASMVLNQEQAEDYRRMPWGYPASADQVLVIHTLCIPPQMAGHGYGTQMVSFAKDYAATHGCTVIRIDTFAHNEPAKSLYQKNGFRIVGYGSSLLEGLIPEEQVYLEWRRA